ncbi:hypothetical protein RhiirC2_793996 [Rhizophagus irregularis]|uniref:Uncharacterized protein n=1 Tax=Rhizophagus irregularis TaxID=588596 RepID=A0A2N1MED8_9GLOM|nr:hypothetical protein RhiirC2_793996 [Rhizophagus irregularis]
MSTKGVQPQWYKELIKVVTDNDGSRNLRNCYSNMNKDWSYKNNLSIYDEEEMIDKNELITWNENNEVIIGKYKKKSTSKKFKKLGIHWIICNNNMLEDSPELIKCKGCSLNVKKTSSTDECLIYLKTNATRVINYRTLNTNANNKMIKPYETLEELKLKNDTLIMLNDILDDKEHMINNNIDLVDRYIDADTKDTFLIKEFIEKFSIYKNLNVILKIDIRKESFEWENKKKLLSSYRLKLEITLSDVLDNKIKDLKFEINIKEIDVTKAQIHGIIILLIIIASSTSISIEIKKSLIWILENFQGEDSDRKKINSKYFLDLNVVMNLIESKNLIIKWKELPKKFVSNVTEQNEPHNRTDNRNDEYLKISLTNLDYNLFVLRWKKNIIHGDFRNHVKVHNQLKYKSDILMSHYLEDVFYQNELQEIDWKRTFNFLKKGTSLKTFYTSNEDNSLRSYKIKNFLKILPTYNLLYERNSAHVIIDLCPRCEKEPETWEHIWICENNDTTEYDVFIKLMIEIEEEYKNGDNEDLVKFKALRILNAELAFFMQEKSKVLILGSLTKVREITRGLFNNKLYDFTRNKIERQVVDEIWE